MPEKPRPSSARLDSLASSNPNSRPGSARPGSGSARSGAVSQRKAAASAASALASAAAAAAAEVDGVYGVGAGDSAPRKQLSYSGHSGANQTGAREGSNAGSRPGSRAGSKARSRVGNDSARVGSARGAGSDAGSMYSVAWGSDTASVYSAAAAAANANANAAAAAQSKARSRADIGAASARDAAPLPGGPRRHSAAEAPAATNKPKAGLRYSAPTTITTAAKVGTVSAKFAAGVATRTAQAETGETKISHAVHAYASSTSAARKIASLVKNLRF